MRCAQVIGVSARAGHPRHTLRPSRSQQGQGVFARQHRWSRPGQFQRNGGTQSTFCLAYRSDSFCLATGGILRLIR